MIVLWSVGGWGVCWWMNERVHEDAGSEGVEVEYVEDSVVVHEGLCVSVEPFVPSFYSWGHAA